MVYIDIVMNQGQHLNDPNGKTNTVCIGIDSCSGERSSNCNNGSDGSGMGNRLGTDANNAGVIPNGSERHHGIHPGGDSAPLPRQGSNMAGPIVAVNRPKSKAMSASSVMNRLEVLLTSFSSLLSSAHTNGVHHSLLPPEDSSHSLSKLLAHCSNSNASAPCSIPCLRLRNETSSLSLPQLREPAKLPEDQHAGRHGAQSLLHPQC